MARCRIVGELRALGFDVSARTVSRYRQQALRGPPSQSWRTFLRNHASSIWAADLCTVQTLPFRTLYVFVVIDHGRRRIRHWNVTEHPIAPWIWRQMIEATAWGEQPGFLIRDRDRSYGGDFIARARRIGIANAIAERVIGTLRRECPPPLQRDRLRAACRVRGEPLPWDRPGGGRDSMNGVSSKPGAVQ